MFLFTQTKFDVIGDAVSFESWYKMIIIDYSINVIKIKKQYYVEDLFLNKNLNIFVI